MIKQENNSSSSTSNKRTVIFCIILAGLLIASVYDLGQFLVDLKSANPLAIALLMIMLGLGFAILHDLGFDFSYKDEIEFQDNIPKTSNPNIP